MTVSYDKVQISIVVVVDKFEAPSTPHLRCFCYARGFRDVLEGFIVLVAIDGVEFVVHICNEQIRPAILAEIGSIHAHSRADCAPFSIRNTRGKTNLLDPL